ncbi:hypothetical protein GC093_17840 [Paenibacillus sp. LMG 31456]|uniref:Uncharacterized protein n=1 Tax=Paenibacillus foliorum TaxID=2654974 RepID=A0A972H2I8_9BACL|nr:hypothetical protein [Paenibacillus foliorum]NOU95071.1 hypothetical protein [Paenibacillus foliorum]
MKTAAKIVISACLLWSSTIIIADADGATNNTQAGTIDDPVITKSYFEQNISLKVAEEMNKQTITEDKVKQIIAAELGNNKGNSNGSTNPQQPSVVVPDSGNTSLTVLKLEPGQTLYGGPGTEMIVRSGKVTIISSDENGVPDVTSGKDIVAGATVELNHLLIIPREGRGIKADPKLKQDIYVMVRGSFLQINADGSKVTP